jgi:hypothetical protein
VKVFRIGMDVNHYQYFLEEREDGKFLLHTDATPRKDGWVPPPVFIFKPKHKAGDFYQFGYYALIANSRANDTLRGFFERAGELLPLPFEGAEYTLLNVLHVVDCLDVERTPELVREGDRYALRPDSIERLRQTTSVLFKIPETARSEILLVEGLLDPAQEFRAVVERAGLKGLLFYEVWSDEDA